MKLKQTTREKELIKQLNELRKKQIISLDEFDDFLKAVEKVLLELDRMRKRLNKSR